MIRRAFAVASVLLSSWAATDLSSQATRLPAGDVAITARPQVSFTVGVEDGQDWEVFASVGDVAFDSRDNLYVLDRGNSRVVAFDSTGRFLRIIGKRGNGPGELAMPQRMTVAGDEVVVSDLARRSFSVFGVDGSFLRSIPFAHGSMMVGERLAVHPRGGVVSLFSRAPGLNSPRAQVVWQPLGGAPAAPLFTAPPSRSALVFAPSTRYALMPGGALAVASTEAYSVRILAPNGASTRVLERAVAPRRVTARDREQERKRREGFGRPGALTIVGPGANALPASVHAQVARQFQNVEFAAVMPVIQALQTDAAGNLWIQRTGPAVGRPGPIDIVTPQGRYVGTLTSVRLPDAFSARGRAAYIDTDDLGVARVVVLRLPRRWR